MQATQPVHATEQVHEQNCRVSFVPSQEAGNRIIRNLLGGV
jgi:hypothetical protein